MQAVIKKALTGGHHSLLESEAKAICLEYGISTPGFRVATSPSNAAAVAAELDTRLS